MDQRDAPTWIAIELTRQGEEKVEDGTLATTLRADLGVGEDFPVFVPATTYERGPHRFTLHLLEGYVFVASGLPETTYFALERKSYVAKVMSLPAGSHHMRTLSVIPDKRIVELRHKLRQQALVDVELGTTVRVVEGTYRGLEGEALLTSGDSVFIRVRLRSLDIIATIPLAFLESSG